MKEKDVRDIIAHYLHTHQPHETAPLEAVDVERILRDMRIRIHEKAGFGVTLTQDHNGAWGPLGQRLLTLRFNDTGGDFIEVSLVVRSVTSQAADKAHMSYLQEDK